MTFFPTMDPERFINEFNDLLEQEELPSRDQIIAKAQLSENETELLSQYEERILPLIRRDHRAWTTAIPPHQSKLKQTLAKLVLMHSENVIGDRSGFVSNLFSKSNEYHLQAVPGGVIVGIKSSEQADHMFELDVFAYLYDNAKKIELEPRLNSGKRSEFKIYSEAESIYIEAKCMNTAMVYSNIFGPYGSVDFEQTEENERILRDALKAQINKARSKFKGEGVEYAVFLDPALPINFYGNKTNSFLQRKSIEGWDEKDLRFICIRDSSSGEDRENWLCICNQPA